MASLNQSLRFVGGCGPPQSIPPARSSSGCHQAQLFRYRSIVDSRPAREFAKGSCRSAQTLGERVDFDQSDAGGAILPAHDRGVRGRRQRRDDG